MLLGSIAFSFLDSRGHEIGLALKAQERGQRFQALIHLSAQEQKGAGGNRSGEENAGFFQIDSGRQLLPPLGQGDAHCAVVVGVHIEVSLRVGELLHQGGCNGVGRGSGGEIEAGAADRQSLPSFLITDAQLGDALHPGATAQVLDEEQGQPVCAGRIDRRNREAMPMGEHQMFVQPGA